MGISLDLYSTIKRRPIARLTKENLARQRRTRRLSGPDRGRPRRLAYELQRVRRWDILVRES